MFAGGILDHRNPPPLGGAKRLVTPVHSLWGHANPSAPARKHAQMEDAV
jgi:hypothetical protein